MVFVFVFIILIFLLNCTDFVKLLLIDNNVLFYRLPYVYLFVFVFVFIYVFFVYWLFYAKIVDFIIDDTGKLLLYFRALKLFLVLLC